jgi:S1-C subfamily serine protease
VARWNPTPSETEYRGEVLVVQGKRVYWVPASLRLIDAVTCEVIVHSPEPLLGGSIQRMQCIGPAPLLEQRISAISAARSASRAASPEAGPHVRSGSGFAVAADLIVTNWHVVENAQTVVCFIDGDSRPATVTARDMSNDLALLSVEGVAFDSHFVLGDASDVRVGQSVYALGFPLPNLLGSDIRALTGIISSLSGFRGNSAQFQIEMSINLGNSGGPLFNSRGQVVGVLSSKLGIGAVQATGSIPEGVGFATKSDMVRSLLAAAGRLEAGSSEPDTKSLEALVEQFKSAVVRVEARTNGE